MREKPKEAKKKRKKERSGDIWREEDFLGASLREIFSEEGDIELREGIWCIYRYIRIQPCFRLFWVSLPRMSLLIYLVFSAYAVGAFSVALTCLE